MKINELKLDVPVSTKTISPNIRSKEYAILGVGYQAVAYYNKRFPDKVIRASYIHGKGDAHYQLLRVFVNHQNNPYFPKIYSYKIYNAKEFFSDDEDKNNYIKKRTALHPMHGNKKYVLLIVMEKLAEVPYDNTVRTAILNKFLIDMREYTSTYLGFEYRFSRSDARKELRNETDDQNLAQAMRIMEPLFNRYGIDIGFNNIMLRRGQIVFTDIFAGNTLFRPNST